MLKIGGIRLVEVDDDSQEPKDNRLDWMLDFILEKPTPATSESPEKLKVAMDTIHHHCVNLENMQIE